MIDDSFLLFFEKKKIRFAQQQRPAFYGKKDFGENQTSAREKLVVTGD